MFGEGGGGFLSLFLEDVGAPTDSLALTFDITSDKPLKFVLVW